MTPGLKAISNKPPGFWAKDAPFMYFHNKSDLVTSGPDMPRNIMGSGGSKLVSSSFPTHPTSVRPSVPSRATQSFTEGTGSATTEKPAGLTFAQRVRKKGEKPCGVVVGLLYKRMAEKEAARKAARAVDPSTLFDESKIPKVFPGAAIYPPGRYNQLKFDGYNPNVNGDSTKTSPVKSDTPKGKGRATNVGSPYFSAPPSSRKGLGSRFDVVSSGIKESVRRTKEILGSVKRDRKRDETEAYKAGVWAMHDLKQPEEKKEQIPEEGDTEVDSEIDTEVDTEVDSEVDSEVESEVESEEESEEEVVRESAQAPVAQQPTVASIQVSRYTQHP
jgi:hypothetical protein